MSDWDRVRALQGEIGAEDFGDVVEMFLEEVTPMIEHLSGEVDRSTLGQDLHF